MDIHIEPQILCSVPEEARKIFQEGILNHPLISKDLPPEALEYAAKVRYVGSPKPSLPINWRFAESIASLKGLEATMLNILLARKYIVDPIDVVINTYVDHATLFIMSSLLWAIDPDGENLTAEKCFSACDAAAKFSEYFPNKDYGRIQRLYHRASVTNIYKTKDDRFFHLHGNMNPDISLDILGLSHDKDAPTLEKSWEPFIEKIGGIESQEIQRLASDKYKQAGTICWTTNEYLESEHGKANAHWPDSPQTSVKRPLAGLKILDITRVIAAPAITRGLAEMGASVMRNYHLDFRKPEDREKLRELVLQADVVVDGYRPDVLNKWGLGRESIIEICKDRRQGIIYIRENCYGWNGPWSYRSGWQQISDVCCGVSMEFGKAMGNDEPVTPILLNSDYCAGIVGVSGVLSALLNRAEKGGSYCLDIALDYYSRWLISTVGTYPAPVWENLYTLHKRPVYRHYHNMNYMIPRLVASLTANCKDELFREEFYEKRKAKNLGIVIRCVKPIVQFQKGSIETVELGFNVGTRGNGTDAPRWPKDLSVEVVT